MSLENQINNLYTIAQSRENALLKVGRYKPNIDGRAVIDVSDSDIFDSIEVAYADYERFDLEVKKESKALFDNLSKGLQFGLSRLDKSLFIGNLNNIWLVLKVKLTHRVIEADGSQSSATYSYDVEKSDPV